MYSMIVNASNNDDENITITYNVNLTYDDCYKEKLLHQTYFGIFLAVPEWEAILTAIILSVIIILTIVGNILVILSVFTYKPLRIVQNFFIVSLAVADLTVAILVLPFNVAYSILGRWNFGIHLCKMWLTCDVLCCTSSILNLSAIALDRYWAITDPINYAQKRTVNRVLLLIAGVWILSLLISSPPLLGWNDWPDIDSNDYPCQLTSNPGYVIYSALGSFYIPLIIMTIVYIKIFLATRKRLRARAKVAKLNAIALKNTSCNRGDVSQDQESISSETIHNESVILDECDNNIKRKRKSKHHHHHHQHQQQLTHLTKNKQQYDDEQQQQQHQQQLHDDQNQNSSSKKLLGGSCGGGGDSGGNTDISITENVDNSTTKLNCDEKLSNKSIKSSKKLLKGHVVHQFIEEKQKISLSKERKAARTLGIIMGVFVVCWLPFFMMYVILPFCPACCPTDKFINFITWLGYINSGINPVIYTIFNLDYRRAFKKLLGIKS